VIQLFSGMQSSLSMVYDREMGNMRMLLVSPFLHWFLPKYTGSTSVSVLQVYAFLLIAWLYGIEAPRLGVSDCVTGAGAERADVSCAEDVIILGGQATG
jgi:ABC-type multidrug transport system permease subunit